MSTHNICLYKDVKKKYTGCNLKTTEFLDCALIGVSAVIRWNTVYFFSFQLDPAVQRWLSARVTASEHFKVTTRTSIPFYLGVVIPIITLTYLVDRDRVSHRFKEVLYLCPLNASLLCPQL